MTDLFDAAVSRAARDTALSKVAINSGNFIALGLAEIGRLPPGDWTGEQIRQRLTAAGLHPHHPNAWGALIRTALKRDALIETGRYEAMTAARSHARKTPVYRRG